MRYFILSIIFSTILLRANSQLLSPTRAKHIKECTVKITIQGTPSVGTGFLVNSTGTIVTCWHVVSPMLTIDTLGKISGVKDIIVEFQNGTKQTYGLPSKLLEKGANILLGDDICVINPINTLTYQTPFLKIGNFQKLTDGDEIITCGYPFGYSHSLISRGMVSAKIADTVSIKQKNGQTSKIPKNIAILDITMNKGNSGGAIYKIGETEADDEVVGIADFIITPVGGEINQLLSDLKKSQQQGQIVLMGVDTNSSMSKIIETLSNMSDGISGCVSIEYLNNLAAVLQSH